MLILSKSECSKRSDISKMTDKEIPAYSETNKQKKTTTNYLPMTVVLEEPRMQLRSCSNE